MTIVAKKFKKKIEVIGDVTQISLSPTEGTTVAGIALGSQSIIEGGSGIASYFRVVNPARDTVYFNVGTSTIDLNTATIGSSYIRALKFKALDESATWPTTSIGDSAGRSIFAGNTPQLIVYNFSTQAAGNRATITLAGKGDGVATANHAVFARIHGETDSTSGYGMSLVLSPTNTSTVEVDAAKFSYNQIQLNVPVTVGVLGDAASSHNVYGDALYVNNGDNSTTLTTSRLIQRMRATSPSFWGHYADGANAFGLGAEKFVHAHWNGSTFAIPFEMTRDSINLNVLTAIGSASLSSQHRIIGTKPSYNTTIFIDDTSTAAAGVGGGIGFRGYYNGTSLYEAASIDARKVSGAGVGYDSALRFNVCTVGGTFTESLYLGSTYNLLFKPTTITGADAAGSIDAYSMVVRAITGGTYAQMYHLCDTTNGWNGIRSTSNVGANYPFRFYIGSTNSLEVGHNFVKVNAPTSFQGTWVAAAARAESLSISNVTNVISILAYGLTDNGASNGELLIGGCNYAGGTYNQFAKFTKDGHTVYKSTIFQQGGLTGNVTFVDASYYSVVAMTNSHNAFKFGGGGYGGMIGTYKQGNSGVAFTCNAHHTTMNTDAWAKTSNGYSAYMIAVGASGSNALEVRGNTSSTNSGNFNTFWNSPLFAISITGNMSLPGGQISFPATQVPSADANTLDDYEEGYWTASLRAGGTQWATTQGFYVKIGRVVHLFLSLTGVPFSSGPSGNFSITGLPFTSHATQAYQGTGSFNYRGLGTYASSSENVVPVVLANTTEIQFRNAGASDAYGASVLVTEIFAFNGTSANYFDLSVTYLAAQ